MKSQKKGIELSFLFLVVPFFIINYIPLRGIGVSFLTLKLTYPFIFLWFLWAMSQPVRIPRTITSPFYVFCFFGFIWLLCHKLTGFVTYERNWYVNLMTLADCFCTFFPAFVFFYCITRNRIRELRLVFYIALVGLVLKSLFMFRVDAGEGRLLATGVAASIEQMWEFEDLQNADVLGYGQVYSLVLIVTGFAFSWSKFTSKCKLMVSGLGGIYLVGIYRAQYTTSIGALLFGLLLCLLSLWGRHRRLFRLLMGVVCIFAVVFLAFPTVLSFLSPICLSVADLLDEEMTNYRGRLISLAEMFSGAEDTYATSRFSLYWKSLEAFAHYPICGVSLYRNFVDSRVNFFTGGHSTFFDTLGMGGLIFGSLYGIWIIMYYKFLTRIYRYKFGERGEIFWGSCWFCCLMVFMLVSCINTSTSFISSLVFIIPSFPFVFGRKMSSMEVPYSMYGLR